VICRTASSTRDAFILSESVADAPIYGVELTPAGRWSAESVGLQTRRIELMDRVDISHAVLSALIALNSFGSLKWFKKPHNTLSLKKFRP
jgi:hypothetical protein